MAGGARDEQMEDAPDLHHVEPDQNQSGAVDIRPRDREGWFWNRWHVRCIGGGASTHQAVWRAGGTDSL